jgi:hypothetical protein
MKSSLLCAVLVAACLSVEAQLVLNPGDTWAYQFNALALTGSTNAFTSSPQGSFAFTLNGATLQNGDSLTYEMFENTVAEAPIGSGTVTFGSPLTITCTVPGAWQDKQGAIRFRMIGGSVTVNHVNLLAIVAGASLSSYEIHEASFVPGPGPKLNWSMAESTAAQIAWPTNFTDFRLEYATNLTDVVWSPVTNSVTTTDDHFAVTIDATPVQRFYRLHKP